MFFLDIVPGDFIFSDWEDSGWKDLSKMEHELRIQGFRKVGQEFSSQNMYVTYKKKKKLVTLTMMLS